jgi:hypothetical protein
MKALLLTQTRKGPGHPAAEQESQRPTANSTPRFIPFPNIKHPPAWSQIVPAGLLPGLLCLLRQPFGPRLPRGPGLEQLGPRRPMDFIG